MIKLGRVYNDFVDNKLRERLTKYGLDLNRVDFTPGFDTASYFNSYNTVDIMLDSFPFGGGTTTPEAIWMGVPVIGCNYPMRHGRMAYSFMHNVGLGNLCADSIDTYPEKVREVSDNVELLKNLRMNLRGRLKDTPLYNTNVFRNAFENAIRDAYIKYSCDNKKTFDPMIYNGNNGKLLQDCVRAADILKRIIEKNESDTDRRNHIINEYIQINSFLLKQLIELHGDNQNMLKYLNSIIELINLLKQDNNNLIVIDITQAIRNVLVKFA